MQARKAAPAKKEEQLAAPTTAPAQVEAVSSLCKTHSPLTRLATDHDILFFIGRQGYAEITLPVSDKSSCF
jgi:hypothetical protein